jgi:uncharacterized membrane protein YfcA
MAGNWQRAARMSILGSSFDLWALAAVFAVALLGSIVGGISGYGTGLLLPLILVPLVGPVPVVPIIALGSLANNSSRLWVFRHALDRRKALLVTALALPGAALAAFGYTLLTGRAVQLLIGTVLIVMVGVRHWMRRAKHRLEGTALGAFAIGYGLAMGGTAGAGVLLVSLLMAAGLSGRAVIATDAAISLVLGALKVAVFGANGLMGARELAYAGLVALAAVPGALVARAILERLPVRVHTAILDAVVLIGGCMMLWGALR